MNEDTLKHFLSSGKKYTLNDIRKHFHVKGEEETNYLCELLIKLEEDAFLFNEDGEFSLLKNREDLTQGILKINSMGDGYVNEVKIPKEYLECALNGDVVLVNKCYVNQQGKIEGFIKKIIKQKDGLIFVNYEDGNILPYRNSIPYQIKINKNSLDKVDNDTRLRIKIDTNPVNGILNAELVNVIGHKDDVLIEEKTIAIDNGFNIDFSEEVIFECSKISEEIEPSEIEKRLDLRDKEIFTIDCVSTKDMDDAISLFINENGNYELGVHIADVAYYVKPNSKTYEEAKNRGTSVYINDTSIPMLDRKLSNGICSLNPNVDRLTKSVIMEISSDGEILNYRIEPSIIRSRMKMNYDDVNRIIEDKENIDEYSNYKDTLLLMNQLSKILEKAKLKRGYIPFNETDVRTEYDEVGNSIDFSKAKQRSAEKIIENFMLAANESVGNYFYLFELPGIYRIHEMPDDEKLLEIFDFINELGFKVKNIKNLNNPRVVQSIIKDLSKTEEFPILSDLILRGMKRARYSTENIGHFGLALDKYIQFTSPIRRFPDLEIHTLLNKYDKFDITDKELKELEKVLEEMAIHSSSKERAADKAEKEGLEMKMAEYMEDYIGEYFNGRITSINHLCVSVKTLNQIEGKVLLSNIKGDHYIVDDKKTKLVGKHKKEVYKVGNLVRVKVLNASKETRQIEYELKENISKQKVLVKE